MSQGGSGRRRRGWMLGRRRGAPPRRARKPSGCERGCPGRGRGARRALLCSLTFIGAWVCGVDLERVKRRGVRLLLRSLLALSTLPVVRPRSRPGVCMWCGVGCIVVATIEKKVAIEVGFKGRGRQGTLTAAGTQIDEYFRFIYSH